VAACDSIFPEKENSSGYNDHASAGCTSFAIPLLNLRCWLSGIYAGRGFAVAIYNAVL
jgi:hypothetical protein